MFSLTPPASPGDAWSINLLYSYGALGGIVIGKGGVLFCTGSAGAGTIFSLTPPASQGGAWEQRTIYTFSDLNGGSASLQAAMIIGKSGPSSERSDDLDTPAYMRQGRLLN